MRLKWLPVRLRRRRRVPRVSVDFRACGDARRPLCTSAGSRPTSVSSGPEGRRGKVAPCARVETL